MTARFGIDTNVLLRVAMADDARQADAVASLLARLEADDVLFVNVSVVLEAYWVLNRMYRYPKERILDFIQAVLERREFEVAAYEAVGNAVYLCRTANVDFADVLLSEMNRLDGCARTFTFDRKAARKIPGMELLA